MPVYGCTIAGTKEKRIVRARSAAQARAHLIDAEPLSAEELADAIGGGALLETATAPAEEPAAEPTTETEEKPVAVDEPVEEKPTKGGK